MALKYLYVPSGYKAETSSGTAYGVLPNVAAADLAFVRGSAGTRVNSDGLVESMATNVPRLDYTDGSCPTLLTEPESTNLVLESEDFTGWNVAGTPTVTENATLDPKGGNNGTLLSLGGSSALFRVANFLAEPTTFSVYLKSPTVAGTYPLNWYASNGGAHHRELVNVTTEWQRFELNFTPTGLGTRYVYVGDNRVDIGGTLSSVYVWGAQVESSSKATSYIKTEAETITRAADTGVISGDLSSYINSSEGVLEIKAKALFNGGSDCRITLSDGTNNNRVGLIWFSSPNNTSVIVQKDATTVVNPNLNIDQTLMTTFKIKWKSGDIQVKVNGTVVFTDTSTFSELILDQLSFSKGTETNFFQGNVQYIKVYDSATDF